MKKLLLILLCLPFIGFGQCISGDCENGYGTYTWTEGDKYIGEWKDSQFYGHGTYNYSNGDKYVGSWRAGQFYGNGTFNYGGILTKEEGDWKNNELWNGIETRYGDNKGESGLIIIYKYENGNVTDTIRNDINFYNKEDIIGEEIYCTIKLIDKITKYDIILQINNTTVKWRFDTGAEGFSIAKSQWEKIKSKIDFEDLNIIRKSKGVGGYSSGNVIRIKDEIEIGGYLVKNVIVSISNDDYSLMGIGFLKKFSNVEWSMKEATLKIYK